MTSHGQVQVNSNLVINAGQLIITGVTANQIQFYDIDWGSSYLHHNNGLIGWLNHTGNWINYTNYGGQVWTSAYGWLHDYINGQASAYAWSAANTRYNQVVSTTRLVHIGDYHFSWGANTVYTPYNGGIVGGYYQDNNATLHWIRSFSLQVMIAGGWYNTYWG